MATILDYLTWRGDLPLCDMAPLNELDHVVLSRFSNLPFNDVYHTGEETMGSFCRVMTGFPREPFQIEGGKLEKCHFGGNKLRFRSLSGEWVSADCGLRPDLFQAGGVEEVL